MRRFRWVWLGGAVLLLGSAAVAWALWPAKSRLPKPVSVPSGDQEIAWINTSSAADTWSQFVIGLKRIEMDVSGISVDVSKAFPEQSTDIPEIGIRRASYNGTLFIHWYKTASDATAEQWVESLSRRDPAPLAVIGGWSSDQAYKLAVALNRTQNWGGDRPLFLISQATAESLNIDPDDPSKPPSSPGRAPVLMNVYSGRSFRFCYTNRQMATAVIDYVVRDLTLLPGPVGWPGFRTLWAGAAGPWQAVSGVADLAAPGPAVFAVEWEDDVYSEDLANSFKDAIESRFALRDGERGRARPHNAPEYIRDCIPLIPYSVGRFARPNPVESVAVREIASRLRPVGDRAILIVPTGASAPARRVLLALAERVPQVGRRVVAVTGDGIGVNTLYRDAEYAWPARSIPIQFVLFAHANPFGWDTAGGPTPPRGYELQPKNSTQDVLAFNELGRIAIDAVFAQQNPSGNRIANRADEVLRRLRERSGERRGGSNTEPGRFFAENGDRLDATNEHVVVHRPTFRYGAKTATTGPDAIIEVHRPSMQGWVLVASVPVLPPTKPPANGDCPQ